MNTTKLELEESKIDSTDDDDFPFVLCTPTKKDNDEVDAQDTIFEEDESPRLMLMHFPSSLVLVVHTSVLLAGIKNRSVCAPTLP
jgi:hypothetical protein